MSNEAISLTSRDRERLAQMIEEMSFANDPDTVRRLQMLKAELDRAAVTPSEQTAPDIVTMNSRVRFRDTDTGEELVYTVTWPELADPEQHKVSVLAPIGMALLGTKVGQIIEWDVPAGKRHFRVEDILFQPEASGDYDG